MSEAWVVSNEGVNEWGDKQSLGSRVDFNGYGDEATEHAQYDGAMCDDVFSKRFLALISDSETLQLAS